jgi:hypothetical protein
MIEIRTIEGVIDALGGRAAAAKRTGRKPNAISMWKGRGAIPAVLRPTVDAALERMGAAAHPSIYRKDKHAPQRRSSSRLDG